MRKTITALLAMGLAIGGFAELVGNRVFSYSSSGKDQYADGSVVRDGECYALVYSKGAFRGFDADGSLVDPEGDSLAAVAPLAKDGACARVAFMLPASYVELHAGEALNVYLIDTRDAGGRPVGLVDGRLARVNRYSLRPDGRLNELAAPPPCAKLAGALPPEPAEAGSEPAEEAVALKADKAASDGNVPQPKITRVWVENGSLRVAVAKTVPCVTYGLLGGRAPGELDASVAEESKDGVEAEEIILSMPLDRERSFAAVASLPTIEDRTRKSK